MKQIGAKQLGEKKLTAKETVRDVRHPRDYKIEHIPGATNKPLEAFDTYKQEIEDYDTIYIYCNTGIDSRKFAKLTQEYQTNIINIKDGILDRKKHYPVEIIKARPTLIQQVHTAAGILILVGIGLFLITESIAYLLISTVVGLGLLTAGITQFCGMAKLLSLAPRNK